MFVEYNTNVEIRDVNFNNKVKNTAILAYLENTACLHSNIAGLDFFNSNESDKSWIILNWKIKMFNRPHYNDNLKIVTWSRKIDRIYALRDFEIYNKNNEIIGIATSRWALIDTNKKKIIRLSDEISQKYENEEKEVFPNFEFEKTGISENLELIKDFEIKRNMIDMNNHVHNIFYIDIANEALPLKVFQNNNLNEIEVEYKKEMKYGEKVKVYYNVFENVHTIVLKDESEQIIHSIIKFK